MMQPAQDRQIVTKIGQRLERLGQPELPTDIRTPLGVILGFAEPCDTAN